MEIPYIVEPRKDTGLFNSKIAIWLFLASEVMLFGGLFSAYIFLRLGADFPWPERALPIVPGLINTAILILSSVTVVFAWAELKLRNWKKFQIYMSITLICAVVFMAIKLPFEYAAKFSHQAIRANNFVTIEGHVLKPKGEDKHVDSLGNKLRVASQKLNTFAPCDQNGVKIKDAPYEVKHGLEVNINVLSFYPDYLERILEQAEEKKMQHYLYLGANKNAFIEFELDGDKHRFDTKTPLTIETLETLKEYYIARRTNNHKLNRKYLNKAWAEFRKDRESKYAETLGLRDDQVVSTVKKIQARLIDAAKKEGDYMTTLQEGNPNAVELSNKVTFHFLGNQIMEFVPAKGTFGGGTTLNHAMLNKQVTPGKENSLEYQQKQITIEHRDKTTVVGAKNILTFQQDAQGAFVKNDKGMVQTTSVMEAKSGIEIAVDQIDFRHWIKVGWLDDDADGKLPLEAYTGKVIDGKYIKGIKTDELFAHFKPITHYKNAKEKAALEARIKAGTTLENVWATHMKWVEFRKKELAKKDLTITAMEKYMVTWKQLAAYRHFDYKMESKKDFKRVQNHKYMQWWYGFTGPDHYDEDIEKAFPYVFVPKEEMRLESNLTPKWNNYYAIYFTITGLHGLHVIGGALVLAYYLFFGRPMFEANPEWLANRVEVGGLFWHFVDLVWIFAFPIFYLM